MSRRKNKLPELKVENTLPQVALTTDEEKAINEKAENFTNGLNFNNIVALATKGVMEAFKKSVANGENPSFEKLVKEGFKNSVVEIAKAEKAIQQNNSNPQIQITDGNSNSEKK